MFALQLGNATAALAQTITLDSITFAAEHRGLQLLDASGSGSRADPYVVVERITGDGPAILTMRDVGASFGNSERLQQGFGFVLVKVVENATSETWPNFELELREQLDRHSDRLDGLSFGQASAADRHFSADRFPAMRSHREPYDGLYFSGGTVAPGERVVIRVVITDHSPVGRFFLLQHRDVPVVLRQGKRSVVAMRH